MQTSVFKPKVTTEPKSRKTKGLLFLLAVMLLGGLGGTSWWWFFGSKPRVVFSHPIAANSFGESECWRVSDDEIAFFGGGKFTLLNLKRREERWSVPVPLALAVDSAWQQSVANRFLKLQQRAAELADQRGKLKGNSEVKAFNIEAAKYAAELASARADATRMSAQPRPVVNPTGTPKKAEFVFGGDRASVDKLNPVQTGDEAIRLARMTKRKEQIARQRTALNDLRTKADTRLKLQQLRDDEGKLQALEQEQKSDEAALAKKPEIAKLPAPKSEPESDYDYGYGIGGTPKFAVLGDRLWLAEGARVVGFDRSSGVVKANMQMPGPVMTMLETNDAVYTVAYVGPTIRYVVKISEDGATQTFYLPVAREKELFETREGLYEPTIAELRNEFFGAGTLAMAEIKLVAKKIEERQAIKPGAEKAAEDAVQSSVGGGVSEALSIMKVVENDKIRAERGGVERVDASTYRVSVRRPFAKAPTWTGDFTGRVQCFSTFSLSLVTGGTKLVALDANNTKLWEANLAAPAVLGDDYQWASASADPCFEQGDRLYFFDRAVLTAFSKATGEVLWRLPSVGIRKVVTDGAGFLYVHSENLPAESLTYLSEMNSCTEPVLMKVNPANGEILWIGEKYEDVWASGKDVYSKRTGKHGSDIEKAVFTPGAATARVKIYKLSTSTGKPRWEWFQTRHPEHVIAAGKTVAILYADELQVIHSTAL